PASPNCCRPKSPPWPRFSSALSSSLPSFSCRAAWPMSAAASGSSAGATSPRTSARIGCEHMAPILAVRRLTKRFAGLVAVSAVNFELHDREILGLIGPNGAGKTTLINMISGTSSVSEGDISFNGRDVTHLPAYRRARMGIGRTFQIMHPFPGLSVLDNVAVGALFGRDDSDRNLARARALSREKLDFVGLAHRAEQRAESLGGPDRKRLELAKALSMRPRLLLLDEVMAGLNL